ncbi:MAG: tRNA (adenosine(37)-N6)-dimethylallyltransferase MiaA [Chloroflexi bacterium]|uniref:tRNA dimethylallyltransferase n=1 Tax=Candidatus Chlorohelix allophototropha TaxID=3003348 RepID=A0A8T7LXS9_9CHLR|nr:tRNA (adenosine(37)-N6)-dimethylallyltransferase MiaA [Chloroflexota bacterium]WJW66923.1 tRNA (adenosine(37)-N6)-dimethylallyltransferase MiaA [Chloroflexota bacterium L227-S17]
MEQTPLKPLIVLTGATAVGKSTLAVILAEKFCGEIVSADSRQVYTGMDIATAKPSPEDLRRVPHHLIDIVPPDSEFTLPDFQRLASSAIEDIQQRGNLPFLVGGTMLYINAMCEGWEVPHVAPDLEYRRKLEEEVAEHGAEALFLELQQLDPEACAHIIPNNARRIIRALEVYRSTGRKFSEVHGKRGASYRILKLGLTLEREALYQRADERIEEMFRRGLVEETRRLLETGYAPSSPAMTGLGYGQVGAYLRGEMSLDEAKNRMRFATHRYIRQQHTWFRRDPAIIWLDATESNYASQAEAAIENFLREWNFLSGSNVL